MRRVREVIVIIGWTLVIGAGAAVARAEGAATSGPATRPAQGREVVTLKNYAPVGLLPEDLEAFLKVAGDHLTAEERDGVREALDAFRTAWEAFESSKEALLRQALDDLVAADGQSDKAAAGDARRRIRRLMPDFPTSKVVYRAVVAKLSARHALRLARLCVERESEREIFLTQAEEVVRNIKGTTVSDREAVGHVASEEREKLAEVEESWEGIIPLLNTLKTRGDVEAKNEGTFAMVFGVNDYYRRVKGRCAQRVSQLARLALGEENYRAFLEGITARRPRRARVVAE
jgi:hypothetical protein